MIQANLVEIGLPDFAKSSRTYASTKNIRFDYRIAAGNSGMAVAHFALMIFVTLKFGKF